MDPHKALLSFCQIDALFSLILFIVENLVVNRQFLVHCLILISSSAGVALSLMEVYVIHQKYYWPLLGASITRLGPMIALSTLWIIHSNSPQLMPLGGVWLAFQVLKGVSLLVYSLTGLHLKYEEKKKSELKYLRPISSPCSRLETTSKPGDISTKIVLKKKLDWDPLEPAYDQHGNLRNSYSQKISWQEDANVNEA